MNCSTSEMRALLQYWVSDKGECPEEACRAAARRDNEEHRLRADSSRGDRFLHRRSPVCTASFVRSSSLALLDLKTSSLLAARYPTLLIRNWAVGCVLGQGSPSNSSLLLEEFISHSCRAGKRVRGEGFTFTMSSMDWYMFRSKDSCALH